MLKFIGLSVLVLGFVILLASPPVGAIFMFIGLLLTWQGE